MRYKNDGAVVIDECFAQGDDGAVVEMGCYFIEDEEVRAGPEDANER